MSTGQLGGILIVAHHMIAQTALFSLTLAQTCLASVYTAVFTVLNRRKEKEDSTGLNTILEKGLKGSENWHTVT